MSEPERTKEAVSYLRLKSKIESLRIDRRFSFMFSRLFVEDSMARILARLFAREGRKYGVGLCPVSQRPSEISTRALSQCNTIIALRMSNVRDQQFVANVLPESAGGLLGALPSLGQQEAIIAGDGVSIAMRMRFDDLAADRRPASDTAAFSRAWQADGAGAGYVEQAVERWRQQKP